MQGLKHVGFVALVLSCSAANVQAWWVESSYNGQYNEIESGTGWWVESQSDAALVAGYYDQYAMACAWGGPWGSASRGTNPGSTCIYRWTEGDPSPDPILHAHWKVGSAQWLYVESFVHVGGTGQVGAVAEMCYTVYISAYPPSAGPSYCARVAVDHWEDGAWAKEKSSDDPEHETGVERGSGSSTYCLMTFSPSYFEGVSTQHTMVLMYWDMSAYASADSVEVDPDSWAYAEAYIDHPMCMIWH